MSSRSIREFRSGILSAMSYKSALWFVRLPTSPGEISQTMRSWYNASVWLLQLYLETNFLDTLLVLYEYNWQLQRLKLTQLSYSLLVYFPTPRILFTQSISSDIFFLRKGWNYFFPPHITLILQMRKTNKLIKGASRQTSNVIKMIERNLWSGMQS